jgi:two-component system cell cycle response regulator
MAHRGVGDREGGDPRSRKRDVTLPGDDEPPPRHTLPVLIAATPALPFRPPMETPETLVLPVSERGSVGTLTVLHGCEAGRIFALDGGATTIGRAPTCGVWIDDPTVSRLHARVVRQELNRFLIEDLRSTNGVFVGGDRVEHAELSQGARIQVGPTVLLRFALVDQREESAQRELFRAATRDRLTGAFNRRYFEERLALEIDRAQRSSLPLALMILDVDGLKGVNDQHGHLAGDLVLRSVAESLSSFVRFEDVLARWGGDEFALLTPAADRAQALALAERLRAGIANLAIACADTELRVTLSAGLVTLDEVGESEGSALVARADARLYGAKRAGKNRVLGAD